MKLMTFYRMATRPLDTPLDATPAGLSVAHTELISHLLLNVTEAVYRTQMSLVYLLIDLLVRLTAQEGRTGGRDGF